MYIHSTDSSCEKTKQEKQNTFHSLTLKKKKLNPEKTKNENCPMKKTSPLKEKFDFDITCHVHQFLHAFCLFCHVLPHYYYHLLLWKTNLVNYNLKKISFFDTSSFCLFLFLLLGKIAGKCWHWKENLNKFPFLTPLPNILCQLWMMMLNGWK